MYTMVANRGVSRSGLYGLGGNVPTEYDLGLFTFSVDLMTAYQKVGIVGDLTRFPIMFAPKFKPTSDLNGRWEVATNAIRTIPGIPGQALWVWNPRVDKPYPVAGTVLERDVAGRRLKIADGSGGFTWREWNYPVAGTVFETTGSGSEYMEVVADGKGGWYRRGPGAGGGSFASIFSSPFVWMGLLGVFYLFKGKK
jgi:hypothetical protein